MTRPFHQFASVTNEEFRDEWVASSLSRHKPAKPEPTLLDVGAGLSRYKPSAVDAGYRYMSHDFNAYEPAGSSPGLQNDAWAYPSHDFVCDILDIPTESTFDVVLCTEVLEHVPDPAQAFAKLAGLTSSGGHVIVTVPFLSLMHQAPYWFSAGLSPFWFRHWADRLDLEVVELSVHGDYADLMAQEWARVLSQVRGGALLRPLAVRSDRLFRRRLPQSLLESGGFGSFFVARKR